MAKLFIWIVVILAVLMVARVLSFAKAKRNAPPDQRPQNNRFQKGATEPMVRCAHCGVYLPRSEALMSNHHTWCSLEHAKHGPRK
ncbi:PP0621 family protein [Paenalcaligenes niemegkensis]|uniref:PP0621 family protein n=1 Tax=Paenalcaligenes niemegkensis TaxID=2895469 RepID=UPI001EE9A900|nr:PP0621 family protein [Paenalcaligenes niemegkensis]MCQ9617421.1 PP0621 family protein [Paenalcaligenes niemegkensis]